MSMSLEIVSPNACAQVPSVRIRVGTMETECLDSEQRASFSSTVGPIPNSALDYCFQNDSPLYQLNLLTPGRVYMWTCKTLRLV